jgi:hypothetical protein
VTTVVEGPRPSPGRPCDERAVIHRMDALLPARSPPAVPRGVEHCPEADEEAHVLLIEPRGTRNTGDAGGERTADEVEI